MGMLDGYNFEKKIVLPKFIEKSAPWWFQHRKQNVIASATTMRDFMNANTVYATQFQQRRLLESDGEMSSTEEKMQQVGSGARSTTGSSVDFSKMSYDELIARDPDHFAKMSFEELLARERTEGRHTLEHNYNADNAPRFSDRIRTMKVQEMKKLLSEIKHEIKMYQKYGRLDEVRDMQAERDQLAARIERKRRAAMNNIFAKINGGN